MSMQHLGVIVVNKREPDWSILVNCPLESRKYKVLTSAKHPNKSDKFSLDDIQTRIHRHIYIHITGMPR